MLGIISKQALRRREGGGQRASRQRAVNRARGAGFGLHLGDAHGLAEQVLALPLAAHSSETSAMGEEGVIG